MKIQNIPVKSDIVFTDGIKHPDLFLWDGWSYYDNEVSHLYCLAVSRYHSDHTPLDPSTRNFHPFHIRHFTSTDEGKTWIDEGCFLKPRLNESKHDSRTIWSGSVEPLPEGRKLVAYTGLQTVDDDHIFLQNIALAVSNDGYTIDSVAEIPLSSPVRDWFEITELGYYLSEPTSIGYKDGENGGPITAWRDPFVYVDSTERIYLFWSAKITSHESAMASALLEPDGALFKMSKLFPPILFPDRAQFTQFELPKIYHNPQESCYYLIGATCNRLYEGQSDAEVGKAIRLYKSATIDGSWQPWGIDGSIIFQAENLFGMTVLKTDFANDRLLCISPYTEAASDELQLTFSRTFYIYLNPVRIVWQ
ncbi:MAG: hypothetical protein AB8G22_26075 [Saprospiraceae bacterium]